MINNYDLAFRQNSRKYKLGDRLLLHVCCAPCTTYCLTRLVDKFDVTLYFANDNITDFDEWQKRLDEVQKLVDIVNNGDFEVQPKFPLKLVVQPFDSQRFFDVAKGLELCKERGPRCTECFKLRLGDTHNYAKEHGFDYFGTTLTVSRRKDSMVINKVGLEVATDVSWLVADFKKHNGFDESLRLAEKYNLYCQDYCGCVFSK